LRAVDNGRVVPEQKTANSGHPPWQKPRIEGPLCLFMNRKLNAPDYSPAITTRKVTTPHAGHGNAAGDFFAAVARCVAQAMPERAAARQA